ncbi:hypothetical protein RSOLAG22IIIB_01142 [Rhizoctonia solani]|uniref:Glycosyltransferase family 8 protein n=1 Tax=Rhizoctonia solani TaxID=456999 RepID=A0A0K6G2K8_9AGAM|nr:hypothetical protein RSOLAG22IIIB_01142 [Rhizoctonia solani]
MPSMSEVPLMASGGPSLSASPYDLPGGRSEYRSSPWSHRWSRPLIFVALFILNNLAWSYFYTSESTLLVPRSQPQTQQQDVVPVVHSNSSRITPKLDHHSVLAPRLETIEIVMVMIGAESATEGVTSIKSAIMHSSRPLSFRLICSEDAMPIIEHKFGLFSRPAYSVDVVYYPMSLDAIQARADRAGVGTKYFAGMGGLVKVFLHELLPDVNRAIFVDTDMVFVVDPVLLWNTFSTLKPDQMLAFPTLGPKSDASLICTCVMLLNLSLMRDHKRPFMSSTLLPSWSKNGVSGQAFEKALSGDGLIQNPGRTTLIKFNPKDPLFGDQGIYHVIWTHFPELFAHLSLRWDITYCRSGYGLKLGHWRDEQDEDMSETDQIKSQIHTEEAPEKHDQLLPGILHFNCQNRPIVWDSNENHVENTWSPMITMITRYKWIWLNRGDGSASVRSTVVQNVRFEDERAAEEERQSRLASEEGGVGRREKARLDKLDKL